MLQRTGSQSAPFHGNTMPSKTKLPDGVVPDTKLFQGTIEGINDLGALSGYKYVLVDDKFIQTSEGALSPNRCYLNTGNVPVEGVASLVIGKGPNEVIILEEGKENRGAGNISVSTPKDGLVTITVTPISVLYATVDYITVIKNVNAGNARAPEVDDSKTAVTALDATADPSGTTQYTFPHIEGYDYQITVDFQKRIDLLKASYKPAVTLETTNYIYDGTNHEPAVVSLTIVKDGKTETVDPSNYDVTYELKGEGNGITVDPYFGKKIAGGYYVSGEASYIEYIGGWYFLFVTYGGLAAGGVAGDYNNGGYQMRVFRSEKPDGPYVDARNTDAVFTNYKLDFGPDANDNRGVNIFGAYSDWGNVAKGNHGERSQGHNSIIAAEDGRTYLVYHTRFQNRGEEHEVRVHQVFQNEDGWLCAAPFEYTGEEVKSADIATTQQVATDRIAGTYKLLLHPFKLNHMKKETAKPVDIELHADGSISGEKTGTWAIQEGTSYIAITIDNHEYKGVLVKQTMENTDDKTIAFSAVYRDGTTIWGYNTDVTSGIRSIQRPEIDDAWYTLSGQRVTSPSRPGIYIHNNRKVIIPAR